MCIQTRCGGRGGSLATATDCATWCTWCWTLFFWWRKHPHAWVHILLNVLLMSQMKMGLLHQRILCVALVLSSLACLPGTILWPLLCLWGVTSWYGEKHYRCTAVEGRGWPCLFYKACFCFAVGREAYRENNKQTTVASTLARFFNVNWATMMKNDNNIFNVFEAGGMSPGGWMPLASLQHVDNDSLGRHWR